MGKGLYPEVERSHSGACKTIPFNFTVLLSHDSQMRRYRDQKSLTSEATKADTQVPPSSDSADKLAPTRFQLKNPVYQRKSNSNTFSVEAEFQRYVAGQTSSSGSDILRFWEVSHSYD